MNEIGNESAQNGQSWVKNSPVIDDKPDQKWTKTNKIRQKKTKNGRLSP